MECRDASTVASADKVAAAKAIHATMTRTGYARNLMSFISSSFLTFESKAKKAEPSIRSPPDGRR